MKLLAEAKSVENTLEAKREEMRNKIANSTTSDVIKVDASNFEETVAKERGRCSPGGFGQS